MDKRQTILQAALELFAERGFHGTAMPLVAKRARVSPGTIYYYFASKEELVNALFQEGKQEMLGAFLQGLPHAPDRQTQFHLIWQQLMEFALAQPQKVRFLEMHYHGAYLDEASQKLLARLDQPFYQFFQEGSASGELRALPPAALIALVWGSFVGLVRSAQDGLVELTPAIVQEAAQSCWEAILAR